MGKQQMSLTLITEENREYFSSVVKEPTAENELTIGVLDKDGAAACAGVFHQEGEKLYLTAIGTDEKHRGKGYAYYLLEEMKDRCRKEGIRELAVNLFRPQKKGDGDFHKWLKRQGFSFSEIPAKRYKLALKSFYNRLPFAGRGLLPNEKFEKVSESPFGYRLLLDEKETAVLLAEPFNGDIYLSFVDAMPHHFSDVRLLMDMTLDEVKKEAGDAEFLYMDIGGYRLMDYVERSLQHRGIPIEEQLLAEYGAFSFEEDDHE